MIVQGWQAHFASVGVTAADIESLAGQIDRPFCATSGWHFSADAL